VSLLKVCRVSGDSELEELESGELTNICGFFTG
jgi:hypothetical protein